MQDEPLEHPGAAGRGAGAGGPERSTTPPDPAPSNANADLAARLELALHAGALGQWTWDCGTDIVTWTPRIQELHGLPASVSAAAFAEFERSILPEDAKRLRATLEDVLRSGREAFALAYRTRTAEGAIRRIEGSGRVFGDDGAGCVVATCMDVTARAEAEQRERMLLEENARLREEARHADQAKSGFLAVISHELRTPLNAIMGYTELWLLGVPAQVPERVRVQIERVRFCAQHLLRLIEEILTYTRIEAGREEARLEGIDLTALARDAANAVRPLALRRGLGLVLDFPPDPVHAETDPVKVRQILANLLDNAVKFTDRGEIRFGIERSSGAVHFDVQDAGIGIAREHHERIFDPFWQIESARTRSREGTGLGLSVARRLARLLGGDVTVTSAPGAGSTFRFRLPLAAPAAGAVPSDPSA